MQHPQSLWFSTANPAPPLAPLHGDVQTDYAIIGAGYTGLAAAHHLTRAGAACVVLEANDAGWGASGRNGGMAVLRYKKSWAALGRDLGHERARSLHRLLHDALDLLEATVSEYRIDCGFVRCGHVTAANGRSALTGLEDDVRWLAAEAHDTAASILDARETAERIGTNVYLGGYLDPRSAGIHPLNYARGLAAGLHAKGVPICVDSAVRSMRIDGGGVVLETSRGVVRARQALVATNAYTDTFDFGTDLGARVLPVFTSVITTQPLTDAVLARIIPQRHNVSDTRHLLNYFRLAPGNRVLYGGRGSLTGRESPDVYAGLERKLVETFPALDGVPIDHRWSGRVAVTLDDFPHVGRVNSQVSYAMGYGGRGVILTNLLGKLLAQVAMGETVDAGPMSDAAFRGIPLHALRIPAMKAVAGYYNLLDRLKL